MKLFIALVAALCLSVILSFWFPLQAQQDYIKIQNRGGGLCLDVHSDRPKNGALVQVLICDGSSNQEWRIDKRGRIISRSGLCLDANSNRMYKNGANVQLWECNGWSNQQWKFAKSGRIINGSGLCLDVHKPDMQKTKARVQLWECNGWSNQQWDLTSASLHRPPPVQPGIQEFSIKSLGGLCLDAHRPDMKRNGARVQVWTCNINSNQNWRLATENQIISKSGLCLDANSNSMHKNGANIQLWECNGWPNQQWRITDEGQIINGSGLCLDVHEPDMGRDGGYVQLWECNGRSNQKWNWVPWKTQPSKERPPLPPVLVETNWVCRDQVPTGWISIDSRWNPTTCHQPTSSIEDNQVLIQRYDNLSIGTILKVCPFASVPDGWQETDRGFGFCGRHGVLVIIRRTH